MQLVPHNVIVDNQNCPKCIMDSTIMFLSSRWPESILGSSHLEPERRKQLFGADPVRIGLSQLSQMQEWTTPLRSSYPRRKNLGPTPPHTGLVPARPRLPRAGGCHFVLADIQNCPKCIMDSNITFLSSRRSESIHESSHLESSEENGFSGVS